MASLPNPVTPSEQDAPTHSLTGNEERAELLAKLCIRDGKSFKASAIEAGFSRAVANNGLKALMSASGVVSNAIQREWDKINVGLEKLKPFAVRRLYSEIVDPGSMNAMRAIEIAGKFKETDWFVRNAEMQLGVFVSMTDTAVNSSETTDFKE